MMNRHSRPAAYAYAGRDGSGPTTRFGRIGGAVTLALLTVAAVYLVLAQAKGPAVSVVHPAAERAPSVACTSIHDGTCRTAGAVMAVAEGRNPLVLEDIGAQVSGVTSAFGPDGGTVVVHVGVTNRSRWLAFPDDEGRQLYLGVGGKRLYPGDGDQVGDAMGPGETRIRTLTFALAQGDVSALGRNAWHADLAVLPFAGQRRDQPRRLGVIRLTVPAIAAPPPGRRHPTKPKAALAPPGATAQRRR